MQPDYTQCAGCWRNSHGEEYCELCEAVIDRKEREKDQEDEE